MYEDVSTEIRIMVMVLINIMFIHGIMNGTCKYLLSEKDMGRL